jgi:hypothetical protein
MERRFTMNKHLARVAPLVVAIAVLSAPTLVRAFNPAAHLFIAERVFKGCGEKIDLFYGSIAPDLAMYVANPETSWPDAFMDTHEHFTDLRSYAFGPIQKAFAKGWWTHNQVSGADYYAHIDDPLGLGPYGYVINKASGLPIDPDFAHYAIEVAIDLLLKGNDPKLANKLIIANCLRSWQDRNLMARVFVWKENKTDWLTLAAAEVAFRNLVGRYASALALPYPWDRIALAHLGVELAQEQYGIDAEFGEVLQLLGAAIELCEGDYQEAIKRTIKGMKLHLWE